MQEKIEELSVNSFNDRRRPGPGTSNTKSQSQGVYDMPRRIPKWVWEKAKEPPTIKAFFLFFMISFFVYTVIRDELDRKHSDRNFAKMEAFNEETRKHVQTTGSVHLAIDLANERAEKQNIILDSMGKSIATIEETLKVNRERQREEHALLAEHHELPKRKEKRVGTFRKKTQRECYKLVPVDKRFGDTIVREYRYVRQKCN
jgi:hypothetical protein